MTDNTSLVRRIKLMKEIDPIGAHIRNDHHAYNIVRDTSQNVMINDVCEHQDCTAKVLIPIEKMNVIDDQLATKAVRSAEISEQQWCPKITPMLRIRGKIITKFEGRMLSIAVE